MPHIACRSYQHIKSTCMLHATSNRTAKLQSNSAVHSPPPQTLWRQAAKVNFKLAAASHKDLHPLIKEANDIRKITTMKLTLYALAVFAAASAVSATFCCRPSTSGICPESVGERNFYPRGGHLPIERCCCSAPSEDLCPTHGLCGVSVMVRFSTVLLRLNDVQETPITMVR